MADPMPQPPNGFRPQRPPKRGKVYFLTCCEFIEVPTVSDVLVTRDVQSLQPQLKVINEVIDCHPIEHVVKMMGRREGFVLHWAMQITKADYDYIINLNKVAREMEAEKQVKDNLVQG